MENKVTVYKAKKSFLWGVLFLFLLVFLGLTLPRLIEGTFESHHIKGLLGFYAIISILALVPFVSKLKVWEDHVETYFLGFRTSNIHSSDILVIEYGNLMRFGGLGYGKGIKVWAKTKSGRKRYFDVGENMYGKEAIAHAKRVLESKS